MLAPNGVREILHVRVGGTNISQYISLSLYLLDVIVFSDFSGCCRARSDSQRVQVPEPVRREMP